MSEHEYKEMVKRKTKSAEKDLEFKMIMFGYATLIGDEKEIAETKAEMEKASKESLKWGQEYFNVFHKAYVGEENEK